MNSLNRLFRARLNLREDEVIAFEKLEDILIKFATTIPFENLSILSQKTGAITKEHLVNKILVRREGGLCYELNPLFYFFLLENKFDARLVPANVYNAETNAPSPIGDSHVAILLYHEGETYVVETGFGGSLPLTPVPLSGQTVVSSNGAFRVKPIANETKYNYALELKIKHKDADWRVGYAFHSDRPIKHLDDLNAIQAIAVEHEDSHFNKGSLITMLTKDGNITLTDNTFTQWKNGKMSKETIGESTFKDIAKQRFNLQINGARLK